MDQKSAPMLATQVPTSNRSCRNSWTWARSKRQPFDVTSKVVKMGESRMLVLMVFSWEIMRRVIYFDGMILVENK